MAGISHGTTHQAARDSSTKTIFMRCMKALNMIVFFSIINREALELHTKRNLKLQLVNSTSSEPRLPPL